jgi:hypothetical protein
MLDLVPDHVVASAETTYERVHVLLDKHLPVCSMNGGGRVSADAEKGGNAGTVPKRRFRRGSQLTVPAGSMEKCFEQAAVDDWCDLTNKGVRQCEEHCDDDPPPRLLARHAGPLEEQQNLVDAQAHGYFQQHQRSFLIERTEVLLDDERAENVRVAIEAARLPPPRALHYEDEFATASLPTLLNARVRRLGRLCTLWMRWVADVLWYPW